MTLTLSTHTLGSHISVTGRSEAPRNRRATSIGWCPADLPRRGMTTFSSAAGLALAKHFPDAEDARSRRPPSGWGARRRRCQRTPGTHRGRRRGRSGRATRGCRGCWRERWIARSRTGGVEAVAAARRSSSISRSIAPASASARRPGASRTISVASVPARSSSPCAIAAQAPSSAPGESDLHSAHRDAARRPRRDERTLTDVRTVSPKQMVAKPCRNRWVALASREPSGVAGMRCVCGAVRIARRRGPPESGRRKARRSGCDDARHVLEDWPPRCSRSSAASSSKRLRSASL
jgi:hypothetical protein